MAPSVVTKPKAQNVTEGETVTFETTLVANPTPQVRIFILLPTGSEERGVLGEGSIPVAILPSCQDMKAIAL